MSFPGLISLVTRSVKSKVRIESSYFSLWYVRMGWGLLPRLIDANPHTTQPNNTTQKQDVRRTFVAPGPKAKEGAKEPRLVAGEVMAYFTRLGYQVAENAGGTVT
jgi:hypothetical protein